MKTISQNYKQKLPLNPLLIFLKHKLHSEHNTEAGNMTSPCEESKITYDFVLTVFYLINHAQ